MLRCTFPTVIKNAFTSHVGMYHLTRMPSGLRKYFAPFWRTLDIILSLVKFQFALVSLDNVFIISRTPLEHINHTRVVPSPFQEAGVTLKLKTCPVFTKNIDYLSHVICSGQLEIAICITGTIHDQKAPITLTGISSFFGFGNVLPRFDPDFARGSASVTTRHRKHRQKIPDN